MNAAQHGIIKSRTYICSNYGRPRSGKKVGRCEKRNAGMVSKSERRQVQEQLVEMPAPR